MSDSTTASPQIETTLQKTLSPLHVGILIVLPIVAAISLVAYIHTEGFRFTDLIPFSVMYLLTGISITAGYHRYFSHRAYDANPILQFFLLVFGAAALESHALGWCSDHRYHHRHVDRDADPYNINKGFFYAHMGWALYNESRGARPYSNAEDLKKNKLIMWQYKYYLPIAAITTVGVPFLMGLYFGRPWGGVVWGTLVRAVVVQQATFLINSAAHYFGKRPYSDLNSARDSWWLAFLSFGEGYHNFHHTFPSDYRNGIAWYHWDPVKWMVRGYAFFGVTTKLRRTPQASIEKMCRENIQRREQGIDPSTLVFQEAESALSV